MPEAIGPGVWLSVADARLVVSSFATLRRHLGVTGGRVALPVEDLHRRILAAAQAASGAGASGFDRLLDPADADSYEDQIGTATAAALLGCTPANVRDLAGRGTLPGRRISGRWVFDRTTVQLEAARRRRC
ncbi:hypothetical protein GOHSU_68_00130 [Gordonia hirsuta DSM 44140 = NBRC 16056]|uniref:Helix-turn-helix domain-containing protein n=1 Tax=Gordonia hirsuta DSM 44140 = NBRC 16056 TaxID=1121927 RepID=L7LE69_9ACTN|nr:helix-turn-helix domain-containing protein [Gordonia hirsuta]GAC59021.1 hypothetical protein GOHSU_68_00130 [Gordonia hirsuta DSM 44140 = NBRC 16056]